MDEDVAAMNGNDGFTTEARRHGGVSAGLGTVSAAVPLAFLVKDEGRTRVAAASVSPCLRGEFAHRSDVEETAA
jgi:hypothetical protein